MKSVKVHNIYLAYNRFLDKWQWTFESMATVLDTYTFNSKEEAEVKRKELIKKINGKE